MRYGGDADRLRKQHVEPKQEVVVLVDLLAAHAERMERIRTDTVGASVRKQVFIRCYNDVRPQMGRTPRNKLQERIGGCVNRQCFSADKHEGENLMQMVSDMEGVQNFV